MSTGIAIHFRRVLVLQYKKSIAVKDCPYEKMTWPFPFAELGPWSKWTECSTTCGGGQQQRTRECGLPKTRSTENPCKQPLIEFNKCNTLPCPSFGDWTDWSPCSVTCGGGNQTRTRKCLPSSESENRERIKELYCEGKSSQVQVCTKY